jgi:hypothetical protein
MDENLMMIWQKCLQFMRDNLNAAEDNSDLKKLEKSFDCYLIRFSHFHWLTITLHYGTE